jgi:hypothetical protein
MRDICISGSATVLSCNDELALSVKVPRRRLRYCVSSSKSFQESADLYTTPFHKNNKSMINKFNNQRYPAIIGCGGGAGQQPCELNGGSPFMHTAFSRITGPLFTERGLAYYARFSLAPLEQTVHSMPSPHRVEQPSPRIFKKENPAAPPPLSLSCSSSSSRYLWRSANV